jgi:hypothetical protein
MTEIITCSDMMRDRIVGPLMGTEKQAEERTNVANSLCYGQRCFLIIRFKKQPYASSDLNY